MLVIDLYSGETVQEQDIECKVRDGQIVDGPQCSYCGNNKWKVNLAKKAQYCTNVRQCGRSIPLQGHQDRAIINCQQLELQEVE
jgi:hypothetical protein